MIEMNNAELIGPALDWAVAEEFTNMVLNKLGVRCHGDTDYMAVPIFKLTPEQIDQMRGQEGVA